MYRFLAIACVVTQIGFADAIVPANGVGSFNDLGYSLGIRTVGFREFGLIPMAPDSLNFTSWMIFDLTGVTSPVTGATLRLHLTDYTSTGPKTGTFPNWETVGNATEPFGVFDVTASAAAVSAAYNDPNPGLPLEVNPAGSAIFSDLGSGTSYGSFLASSSAVGTDLDIVLNSAAVSAINAGVGTQFVLGIGFTGGHLPGILGQLGAPLVNQTIGLSAEQELILQTSSVPEPSTFVLTTTAAIWLMYRRRKGRLG